MRILLLILSLGIFIGFLCTSFKKKEKVWHETVTVPGIIFIDEEMGIDQTEVTNFHWLEYLYWLAKVHGKESQQYKNALPDTSLWLGLDSSYHSNAEFYLRHPSFRDYPVVNITWDQATEYCKWRSERVFVYYLIRIGDIEWDSVISQGLDTIITIERYKEGKIPGLKRNPRIDKFPDYHLPGLGEVNKTMRYLESASQKKSKRELRKLNTTSKTGDKWPMPVLYAHWKRKPQWIYHFGTNVSEWVAEEQNAFGQNWLRYTTNPLDSYSFESKAPHPGIGFRCAFTWIE